MPRLSLFSSTLLSPFFKFTRLPQSTQVLLGGKLQKQTKTAKIIPSLYPAQITHDIFLGCQGQTQGVLLSAHPLADRGGTEDGTHVGCLDVGQ